MSHLTFKTLSEINIKRTQRWHPAGLEEWTALEWAGCMAGEAGEACNAAKKLKRIDSELMNINLEDGHSLTTRQAAKKKIAKEVADTIIYGMLLLARIEVDVEEVIREVFNQKSEEYNFPERI